VSSAEPLVSRRERARAATIDEIKQTALQLIRDQGSTDVRFSDIARQMGMTPPALYRYFADRDELLTAMIADAYDDLGQVVAKARDAVPAADLGGRFFAVAQAYRDWARGEPERFALIFGLPVPGYVAPVEGPTTEAAARAMAQLKSIFFEAAAHGKLRKPLIREVGPALRECARAPEDVSGHPATTNLTSEYGVEIPDENFQAMLHVWTGLHGFVCLDTYGHFDWLGDEARHELFVGQVKLIAKIAGLPAPADAPSE
jgi:AcrR family transcriptional regulator